MPAGDPFLPSSRDPIPARSGRFAVDAVGVFWYTTIAILCIAHYAQLTEPAVQTGFFAAGAAACAGLSYILQKTSRTVALGARAVLFCLAIPLTFEMVGRVVPLVSPDARESWLRRADLVIFRSDPTRWIGDSERFPALTELLMLVYSSFYFLPIILAIRLWIFKKFDSIEHVMLVIVTGFLFSYFGYLLIPGRSPYQIYSYPFEFRGLFATPVLRDAVRAAESNRYDAFPSGHCEVTWLTAACAFRHDRRAFYYFFLPVAVLLPIGTVYLRYHYGVDVLAAIPFALVVWYSCNQLMKRATSP